MANLNLSQNSDLIQAQKIFGQMIVELEESNPLNRLSKVNMGVIPDENNSNNQRKLNNIKKNLRTYPEMTNFCVNIKGECYTFLEYFAYHHSFFPNLHQELLEAVNFYPSKHVFFDLKDQEWLHLSFYTEDILFKLLKYSSSKDTKATSSWSVLLLSAVEKNIGEHNLVEFEETIKAFNSHMEHTKNFKAGSQLNLLNYNDAFLKRCQIIYETKTLKVDNKNTKTSSGKLL